MKKNYIAMSCACILLAILAWQRGGLDALAEGLRQGGITFLELTQTQGQTLSLQGQTLSL